MLKQYFTGNSSIVVKPSKMGDREAVSPFPESEEKPKAVKTPPSVMNARRTGSHQVVVNTWSDAAREASMEARHSKEKSSLAATQATTPDEHDAAAAYHTASSKTAPSENMASQHRIAATFHKYAADQLRKTPDSSHAQDASGGARDQSRQVAGYEGHPQSNEPVGRYSGLTKGELGRSGTVETDWD